MKKRKENDQPGEGSSRNSQPPGGNSRNQGFSDLYTTPRGVLTQKQAILRVIRVPIAPGGRLERACSCCWTLRTLVYHSVEAYGVQMANSNRRSPTSCRCHRHARLCMSLEEHCRGQPYPEQRGYTGRPSSR